MHVNNKHFQETTLGWKFLDSLWQALYMPSQRALPALSKLSFRISSIIFELPTLVTLVRRTYKCLFTKLDANCVTFLFEGIFCKGPCYAHWMKEVPTVRGITVKNLQGTSIKNAGIS
jgi:hypothetical protein